MDGWVGDKWEDLQLFIFADANWAEKPEFVSTSGCFLCLHGPNTFFPLAAMSKKQTAKSHSTPEAEIVAADMAIRLIGLPSLQLWDCILGQGIRRLVAILKEDNEAAIKVMNSGKNPTMRHMQRTHGLDLAWLTEQFQKGDYRIEYSPTRSMFADVFTKAFTDRLKWILAKKLIGHFKPDELEISEAKAQGSKQSISAIQQGGGSKPIYKHDRVIIEYCCSPDSRLGRKTKWSKNCLTHRITENEDATKVETIQNTKDLLSSFNVPVLVVASIPCTGGSAWQHLNIRRPGGQRLMRKHRMLFNKLWHNLEIIAEHAWKLGHFLAIEWARHCQYWRLTKVRAFLHRYNMLNARFDGCMFGLKSTVHSINLSRNLGVSARMQCLCFMNLMSVCVIKSMSTHHARVKTPN